MSSSRLPERMKRGYWLLACLAPFVALFTGYLLATEQYTATVAVVVLILLGRFAKPRPLSIAAAVLAAVLPSTIYWLNLPASVAYVADLVLVVLILAVVHECAVQRKLVVPWWILLFVLVLFASLLAEKQVDSYSFRAAGSFLLCPLAFVAVMNAKLSRSAILDIVKALVALAALQVPVTVAQWAILHSAQADRIGGTFGRSGTTTMAVVMAAAWSFALAAFVLRPRVSSALLLLVPFVPLVLGEVKGGFFLASVGGLGLLLCILLTFTAFRGRRLLSAVLVGLPIGVMLAVYRWAWVLIAPSRQGAQAGFNLLTSAEALQSYGFGYGRTGQANRLESLVIAWDMNASSGKVLLGSGPGTHGAGTSLVTAGTSGSLAGEMGWATSAARTLLDSGVLGVAAFLVLLLAVGWVAFRLYRSSEEYWIRVFGLGLVGAMLVFAFGGFYSASWHTNAVAMPFWIMAGMAAALQTRPSKRRQDLSDAEQSR